MLFTSLEFVVFIIIVLALYWAMHRHYQWQNTLLLVASYIFYGAWDWRFLSLLWFTTFSTFVSGIMIERHPEQKRWLLGNILINLLILCTFKYFNFFSENLYTLLKFLGWKVDLLTLDIVLPLGISFYTFQAIGYSVDVKRGSIKASHDIVEFSTFIAYFAQLISGPIERAKDIFPQLRRCRNVTYEEIVLAFRQILWGVVKKVVVADSLRGITYPTVENYFCYSGATMLLSTALFAIELYCDFSSYSDIAVGVSRLFGIRLSNNFHFPLFSRSFNELWQRWNITFIRWLRDYIYIPLGGNKRGLARTIANVFVVFLISGLWHGASWNFIIWALANFLFMLPMIVFQKRVPQTDATLRDLPKILVVFLLFALVFNLYIAPNAMVSIHIWQKIFSLSLFSFPEGGMSQLVLYIIPMFIVEWLGRHNSFALERMPKSFWARHLAYMVMFALIITAQYETVPYIYFQF